MQKLMKEHVGESISLIQAKWRADAWAKENISECFENCDQNGLLNISQPDGIPVAVPCPVLSRNCSRGKKFITTIDYLAVQSLPQEIPILYREEVASAAETLAIKGARNWSGKGFLYLYGDTGTGKSFAAAWRVYNDLHTRLNDIWDDPGGWRVAAVSTARWFSAFSICLERGYLQDAAKAEFLILDDLGCELRSPTNIAILNELISVRYNERRPTIITSNCNLAELESRYQPRMYERIIQSNSVVDVGTINRRLR